MSEIEFDRYIVDGPHLDVEYCEMPQEVRGRRTVEWIEARVQEFTLTYRSDYHLDYDRPPFEGALEDGEASLLAEETLRGYVAGHRLEPVGSHVSDGMVSGAGGETDTDFHTIVYRIIEKIGSVNQKRI